jgi:hypothetical protein
MIDGGGCGVKLIVASAGVTDHLWKIEDIVKLLENKESN